MSLAVADRIPDALPIEVDPPRTAYYASPAEPTPDDDRDPPRAIAYLRHRWATVAFLGAVIGGVLAFAAWSLIPAKYTTYSIIRVAPQDPRIYYNEDPNGRGDFATYLKTQAGLLRSYDVLLKAVRDPEIAGLPMLKSQVDPVRFLEEELVVEFSDGSELIKPKLSGDDPRAITAIVNAVHAAYFSEVVDAERRRKLVRLKAIDDSVVKMQQELERKRPADAKAAVAESLPGVGPNLAASQVARLREKLDGFEVRQKTLEAERDRLPREPKADDVPLPPGFLGQLEADPEIVAINRQVAQWQEKLDYLVGLTGDKPNEATRELREKVAGATKDRERVRRERAAEYRASHVQEAALKAKADAVRLDADIASLTLAREKTRTDLTAYEEQLKSVLPATTGPKDFGQVDAASRTELIGGMIEKANLLRLELSAPSRVQSSQKAAAPMKRDGKRQLIGTVAAGIMGFLLVGAGVVAYESRLRRTMSLQDVRRLSFAPVVGAIPAVGPDSDAAALAVAEEAIEQTRANLVGQFGGTGGKVVLVTSALAGEGSDFLARELALSFARAGGQTLLVDFDLRSPTLHEAFDLPNEIGCCELLTGEADVPTAAAILPDGIALVTAGRWSDVVRQYLSPDRINDLVCELRARFDVVVMHGHPVLAVAETALAARTADAVLLAVQKHASRLPLVERAQEKIASVAPDAFGVVYLGASAEECFQ